MNIDIVDVDRLISVNKLKEVTSTKWSSNKMMFDQEGILSNEIFGTSRNDRRNTFAYINLKRYFIHPHIYKVILKRVYRKIIYIVAGQKRFIIKDGILIEDENGWTGIDALYDNWNKIDWKKIKDSNAKSTSTVQDIDVDEDNSDLKNSVDDLSLNLQLLTKLSRDQIFLDKFLVIPPAYRDVIISGTVDNSDMVNELNNKYLTLLRGVSQLQEGGLFARTQFSTQARVQDTLVDIYSYFKSLISSKTGMIRKYLMGKSIDYGTRTVISSPNYNFNKIEDSMTSLNRSALPISQCCSCFYPFIESWLFNFFTREIINDPNLFTVYDKNTKKEITAIIKDPELQFSEKKIKKMINNYCLNPDNRFEKLSINVIIPSKDGDKETEGYLMLKGKAVFENKLESLVNRPMTITDILYLACVDVCEKRHINFSRYPVGTDKGIVFTRIVVQSTTEHCKLTLNGKEYPYYPVIDLDTPKEKVSTRFIDSFVMSNSHCDGLGADYDGDTMPIRGIWSDEANLEAEQIMKSKITNLGINGNNMKVTSAKEVVSSYFILTKENKENAKNLTDVQIKELLELPYTEISRDLLISYFASTANSNDKNNIKIKKARFNTFDYITIPNDYFYKGFKSVKTTIGRFIFNKFILEAIGCVEVIGYINEVVNKGKLGDLDAKIGNLFLEDVIDYDKYSSYSDRRDCLAYWINGFITPSLSPKMSKPLPEIEKKKKELLKKYEKEISEGNIDVMTKIQNELIAYAKDLLKDDPSMDLFNSGDLDFKNNYKNNSIIKGAVINELTGEYDFIGTSFMNGIDPKDIPAHSNSILASQFPSAIETAKSGYMGKQLLALLQMAMIDEPGTDCGTKRCIPIKINNINKGFLNYSYIQVGDQLRMLDSSNIDSFVGKTVMMRSPMACKNEKFCSICGSALFHKLGVTNAGLFGVQISHTSLNLALKSKHDASVNLFEFDPNAIIEDI